MNAEDKRSCELFMLALLIWREARGESLQGRLGVAWTVRNRVQRPSWWGTDYISVITKKWQYSSLSDPRDRQLTTWPSLSDQSFIECYDLAREVIEGAVTHPFPGADSYYDSSISAPRWATRDKLVGRVGRLTFFNIDADNESNVATEG